MIESLKKINFLITKRQRKGFIILSLLLFFGMILEVFGLGILLPLLTVLLDPKSTEIIDSISPYVDLFNNLNYQQTVLIFLGLIVSLYIVKSLFLVFLNYKQNQFLSNINAFIGNKLFSSYLNQPYDFHVTKNSSSLIKNLQIEINYLNSFFLSLISVFIEGGFVLSILITIVYIEPFGAVSIGLFYGILSIIFLQFTKKKLFKWGKNRQSLDNQISKIALEGLGGIKDLIVIDKISFFTNMYCKKNYKKAILSTNQATISQVPRFFLELISILGLVTFISLLILNGKDTTELFSILGVFVAATFRMIPSLNRIISAFQIMKFHRPSLDVIYSEIQKIKTKKIVIFTSNRPHNFTNSIKFSNVHFSYNKTTKVLNNINLTINKGQTIGFIGESGSGKSTLVDLLLGLYQPTQGQILIDGVENTQYGKSWRSQIGYVSQSVYLIDDTIKANIAFGVSDDKIDNNKIEQVLRQVQLYDFVLTLKNGINSKVGERGVQISGGQKQRIAIARALYNDPSIIIFDEATSALDTQIESQVINSLMSYKGNKTIIMIAHRVNTLSQCDQIFNLKDLNEIT